MNLYLVKASITRQDYMADARKPVEDIRPVYANSVDEAEEKYRAFWAAKESDYDVSYRVSIEDVIEPIL